MALPRPVTIDQEAQAEACADMQACLAPLLDAGVIGVAVAGADGRVLGRRGALSAWLSDVADLRNADPFVGMDDDLERVRRQPGERVVISNMQFGNDPARVNIAVLWDNAQARYTILTTAFGAEELTDVAFARARREERVAKDMLASERRRSMELYRRAPAMLCTLDRDGRILEASDHWCEHLLMPRHEAIGRRLQDLALPDAHADIEAMLLRPVAQGRAVQAEPFQVRRADGAILDVEISAVPSRVLDHDQAPVSDAGSRRLEMRYDALVVLVDVTARNDAFRQLEETAEELVNMNGRLQTANGDLEIFAHGASHDLLTGLHQIGWSVEMAQMTLESGQPVRPHLDTAREVTARMDETVRGLLTYARASSRPATLDRLDPARSVAQARTILDAKLASSHAVLEVAPLPEVRGDGTLMAIVFQNLIENAIKYCDTVPHVRISGTRSGARVVIHVDDNGVGIPPEQRDIIFKPFRRVEAQSMRPGTGIGLTLCRRAIELMDGTIYAADSPLGGNRVTIYLPSLDPTG